MPVPPPPPQTTLVVAIIGRNAPVSTYPLFMRIRKHGLYVRNVSTENARDALLRVLTARAQAEPEPYAHWYIDGGDAWALSGNACESITHFTYPQLTPINNAVLKAMDEAVRQGTGPEVLESRLSHLSPAALGAKQTSPDPAPAAFVCFTAHRRFGDADLQHQLRSGCSCRDLAPCPSFDALLLPICAAAQAGIDQ